ncbi:secretory phospholipase A2 [Mytilus galloprovincialis]|uniref:Phospholipase A2 n=2 Tax=Mytilus galloprovincialis TaxID=29158 RepID=A0A8B6EZL4_MYTGA|nr:secretory phospholipase A2 [Mytilus galloprovincialis]
MLTLHYITACVLCVAVQSSPPGYSKSVLSEVMNYMERSELDDVNALDDQADVHSNISKKAMWNFSNLMIAIFGYRRGIALLDYGCYCGFGGAGTPVDGIDRCCQAHDKCYGDEEDWWCRTKWTHYNYKILNERTVDCKDSYGSCKYRVCRCDKVFIDCLHRNTYNPANYNIC